MNIESNVMFSSVKCMCREKGLDNYIGGWCFVSTLHREW